MPCVGTFIRFVTLLQPPAQLELWTLHWCTMDGRSGAKEKRRSVDDYDDKVNIAVEHHHLSQSLLHSDTRARLQQ